MRHRPQDATRLGTDADAAQMRFAQGVFGRDAVEHADPAEYGEARTVEGEAGSRHVPVVPDFNQKDGDALPRQRDRRLYAAMR